MRGQRKWGASYMNNPIVSKKKWHKQARIDRITQWIVSVPPHLFLVFFLVLPACIMVLASLRYPGEFGGLAPLWKTPGIHGVAGLTLENYRFVLGDLVFVEILLKSAWIAFITTLLCLVLAYPLALLIAHRPKRQRELMVLFVILPFACNFLIRIYAWIIILGPFNLLYSPFAVIIGMVYVHLPLMVLPLYTNLEKHDPLLLDAARDLGAHAWQRFWHLTFPLSLSGIFAGSALVFIPALGMLAVPELLGGTGDIMIGNLIKEQFLESRYWPFGATFALVLTLILIVLISIQSYVSKRVNVNA